MFAAINQFLTKNAASIPVYLITNSLRFRSSASAYLNRTPATATNRTTWTYSAWVKRGTLGAIQNLFDCELDANNWLSFWWYSNDAIGYDVSWTTTANRILVNSPALYRDPAAWYHVVLAVDTTQATAADRVKIYVNGSAIAISTYVIGSSYIAQNTNLAIDSTGLHSIGSRRGTNDQYFDGELAEVNFVDGYPTGVTSGTWAATNVSAIFGAYSTYNQWLPTRYAGTYGTNGFYLPFTNTTSTSTLVADSSGNGNNWTPNNISLTAGSTYDSLIDVPSLTSKDAANYAVLNPLDFVNVAPINGNLILSSVATSSQVSARATIGISSGKWYWEQTLVAATSTSAAVVQILGGVCSSTYSLNSGGGSAGMWGFQNSNGAASLSWKFDNGANTNAFTRLDQGDIVSFALDMGAGTLAVYRNNTLMFTCSNSLTGTVFPVGWVYAGPANTATTSINFGQQPFTYSAPSGFVALNTFNIAAGTVTTSGTFTGNASTDGPMVWLNGTPTAMTINGNAVTFGTHADKLANGFKVRSSSASYNASGSNTYTASTVGAVFKYEDAQANP